MVLRALETQGLCGREEGEAVAVMRCCPRRRDSGL